MKLSKFKNIILEKSSVGLFSKAEAASLVASGCQHIHSSILGRRDPLVALTFDALQNKTSPTYPWELHKEAFEIQVTSSRTRHRVVTDMLAQLDMKAISNFAEKIKTVTEELLSNSIFHAYRNSDGTDKYARKQAVELTADETIYLRFQRGPNGIFMSIKDSGVGLSFNSIQSCFERCYSKKDASQIETKSGGAGLGLYLTFELSTHLKIISGPKFGTEINCWFPFPSTFDQDYFSFNFFEEVSKL